MDQLLSRLELDYTNLEFYDHYVISRINEGAIITSIEVRELIKVCIEFYKNKPYVYISKRENNFNVDPTIYFNLEKLNNLAGIAVVSTNPSSINMAAFEQKFSKIPFDIFLDLEDALEWSRERIKNKKADL